MRTLQRTVLDVTGVFVAIGHDPRGRQAITAAGTGCAAALFAERFIASAADNTCAAVHAAVDQSRALTATKPNPQRARSRTEARRRRG